MLSFTEIRTNLPPGGKIQINHVYPELGSIQLAIGEINFTVTGVTMEHMQELMEVLDVSPTFSLLSNNSKFNGKQVTKHDAADFIDDLIMDREEANDAPTV